MKFSRAPRTSGALTPSLLRHVTGIVGGLAFAAALTNYPFGDVVAPIWWTVAGAGVTVALLAFRSPNRAWVPLALIIISWLITVPSSWAPGSSWAVLTWIPLVIVATLASALTSAFLLTATAVTLIQQAGALVILKNDMQGFQVSGSVPYFLGFIGVVGAVFWQGLSSRKIPLHWPKRVVRVLSAVVAAGCAWMALASGSRAAVLGLLVATVGAAFLTFARSRYLGGSWRRGAKMLLVTILLVPVLDIGLTSVFATTARSTVLPVLIQRGQATQYELGKESGSFRTRLQFWRQAMEAAANRPQGHGLASYAQVIHTYQDRPMLWSANPHNFLALSAFETGVAGFGVLLLAIGMALAQSIRWSTTRFAALVGSGAIMSLDIFSGQPVQGLLWWAVLGAALASGPEASEPSTVHRKAVRLAGMTLMLSCVIALGASARFYAPCKSSCNQIARYAGHPGSLYPLLAQIHKVPDDLRWVELKELYPHSFWLDSIHADSQLAAGNVAGYFDLLRHYPFQSVDNYLVLTTALNGSSDATTVAQCGLELFFDGRQIWRDNRSSAAELEAAKMWLEELLLASAEQRPEGAGLNACRALGIDSRFYEDRVTYLETN